MTAAVCEACGARVPQGDYPDVEPRTCRAHPFAPHWPEALWAESAEYDRQLALGDLT